MPAVDVGDIVWVELDDIRGTEQSGRRPALVLTSQAFHEMSRRAIICPISSKMRSWPTVVALPPGLKTRGVVLIDQVRSIDRAARMFHTIERVPQDVVQDVRARLGALLGTEIG
ncbi:type II toxin-antitoxin system PemK/MazF family toxin [Rhodopseudomonas palustris]|uniref:Type II toxin-antitoxin system PemK/MazF family toxin n=2 Tax=Rhodopseudomonas palustris TaxID=1076 RepID=A0A323UJR0_RHOPL|nr:type II toxin-antitoxin system PemK/MazF family toxin [Rhodopseudomonas palustris]PZA12611.1 type II toxin-antitoxin system PemK/MazF family toxin [Rhodopseudomonas palustris]